MSLVLVAIVLLPALGALFAAVTSAMPASAPPRGSARSRVDWRSCSRWSPWSTLPSGGRCRLSYRPAMAASSVGLLRQPHHGGAAVAGLRCELASFKRSPAATYKGTYASGGSTR